MQKTSDSIVIFLITSTCVIIALVGFIITIIYLYRKRQVLHIKGLEKLKSDYEKTLLKTQLEIQELTFQSISRNIHDNINLSLTLAKLNLVTIDDANSAARNDKIAASIDLIGRAITDLSDISQSMNSEIIAEQGLISALEREAEKLRSLSLFTVKVEIAGNAVFMDARKELFIFRIVQEAFNNILKHSQAEKVNLRLYFTDDRLSVTVADDGVGFDLKEKTKNKKKPTAGLRNMMKRAEILGGGCSVSTNDGNGTIVKLSIPFKSNDEQI
jgi:two-component system NarL family sensor kinase